MFESTISLIHGDAINELKNIKSESINLIVADPPYNLGKDYEKTKDNLSFDEYLEFSNNWIKEAYRILKKDGTIYIFMGVRFISYIFKILDKDYGMKFHNWICWHYTQGLGKTKGFSPRHDDILMFSKNDKPKFNMDSVRVPQKYYRSKNNMRGANPGDVWQFSHVHYCNENRQDHPTQKPEGLIERMILASSDENDLILDPFCGTGTTLRVCQQLKRNCIGIEINTSYINLIENRLSKPFQGFDSIDPRMMRVPLDMKDETLREEYLINHEKWFLNYHNSDIKNFREKVSRIYNGIKDEYKIMQNEIWFDD